jgi:AhpC/TSA family
MVRAGFTVALFLLAGAMGLSASEPSVRLRDLDNTLVNPFEASPNVAASVFLFTSVDCPISNRYAPEVRKLYDAFSAKGVAFWLVYPNPSESVDAIRAHLKAFHYPGRALRDPKHLLASLAKVNVTPEAAVYDRRGSLVYHGRIDDRYVSIGVERPAPTRHDVRDALTAVLAGKMPQVPMQPAVGCFIADFVP